MFYTLFGYLFTEFVRTYIDMCFFDCYVAVRVRDELFQKFVVDVTHTHAGENIRLGEQRKFIARWGVYRDKLATHYP